MSGKKLENGLIEHCAPTLAGLKSAGLFRHFYEDSKKIQKELEEINVLLNVRGVYVEALSWEEEAVLIYAYRPGHLQRELEKPEVMELLAAYGYGEPEVGSCIRHLKSRLRNYVCFPHEIGIFLGYPLEDVKGFIDNSGKNCKCCGLWKVYGDEKEKRELFYKLTRCSEIYRRVFAERRNIVQMTVCA